MSTPPGRVVPRRYTQQNNISCTVQGGGGLPQSESQPLHPPPSQNLSFYGKLRFWHVHALPCTALHCPAPPCTGLHSCTTVNHSICRPLGKKFLTVTHPSRQGGGLCTGRPPCRGPQLLPTLPTVANGPTGAPWQPPRSPLLCPPSRPTLY